MFAAFPPCWQPVLARHGLSPDTLQAGSLAAGDGFGSAVAAIGDLDGDGNVDLAVGAPGDDGRGGDRGAVWIVFLASDTSIKRVAKIGDGVGGFSGTLDDGDRFGAALAGLGDADGDGIVDLAVGAPGDDDGGNDRGALWILLLQGDGMVKAHEKISASRNQRVLALTDADAFGSAVTRIGDLDGDSIAELAVGAPGDDDGSFARGAVWVLFLDRGRRLRRAQKISAQSGDLGAALKHRGWFGRSLAALGDFDHDGVADLVVGAPGDETNFAPPGSVYLLMLRADGTVKSSRRIDSSAGVLAALIYDGDRFGMAVAAAGDRAGDGGTDLAVGAPGNGPIPAPKHSGDGAFWILDLSADGSVKSAERFARFFGSVPLTGSALAAIGDQDDNAVMDIAVGAPGTFRSPGDGDAWIELLNGLSPPTAACGDPSGDGQVTATDALRALQAAVGSSFCDLFFCDVNRDGKITATDAARILSNAVGTATLLACPECTTTTITTIVDECFDDADCGPGEVCLAYKCFPATTTTVPSVP